MFSKKALSAAIAGSIAAGFAVTSNATMVNAGKALTYTVGSTTITSANKDIAKATTFGGSVANGASAVSGDLRLTQTGGFGVGISPVFVKVTLTNATFGGQVSSPVDGIGGTGAWSGGLVVASDLESAGFFTTPTNVNNEVKRSVSLALGGATGDSTVTYQVLGASTTDDFTFDMPALRAVANDNITVKVDILANATDTTALKTFTLTNSSAAAVPLVTITNDVVQTNSTTITLTAAVATQFKQFSTATGTTTRGSLGTLSIGTVSSALNQAHLKHPFLSVL